MTTAASFVAFGAGSRVTPISTPSAASSVAPPAPDKVNDISVNVPLTCTEPAAVALLASLPASD